MLFLLIESRYELDEKMMENVLRILDETHIVS